MNGPRATIDLGTRSFEIGALTFGQLKRIMAVVQTETDPLEQSAALIAAALANDHPGVVFEDVFRGDVKKLTAAAQVVLELSGLKEPAPGEARAPSPGATFTAGSRRSAATRSPKSTG